MIITPFLSASTALRVFKLRCQHHGDQHNALEALSTSPLSIRFTDLRTRSWIPACPSLQQLNNMAWVKFSVAPAGFELLVFLCLLGAGIKSMRCLVYVVLGTASRASCTPGKSSAIWAAHTALVWLFCAVSDGGLSEWLASATLVNTEWLWKVVFDVNLIFFFLRYVFSVQSLAVLEFAL